METRYKHNAGAVFSLKVHLVWCPKYRKPVLVGAIEKRFRQLIVEKAKELDLEILAFEIMPEHVHLFIEFDPRWCIAEIVNRLKGYTSHQLRKEFRELKSRLPCLWSRSYYAGTVGFVSDKIVKQYIANQKGK